MKLSQRAFAKMTGASQALISQLELGNYKLKPKQAKFFARKIRKVKLVSKIELKKRETQIAKRGRFHGEYARRMGLKSGSKAAVKSIQSKTPTKQEKYLKELFLKHLLAFESQVEIKTQNQTFVIDFVINSATKPKTFIEVKTLNTRYAKRLSVIELAYKSIKLKQAYPKSHTLAIIQTNKLLPSELKILKNDFDHVLLNPTDREVIRLFL
ncbi:hypothetical protein K8R43_06400 [archaeon]|nr:hypothetical protein [archaeon]